MIDDFMHHLAEKQKAAAAKQRAELAEQELQQLRALLAQHSMDVNHDLNKGD